MIPRTEGGRGVVEHPGHDGGVEFAPTSVPSDRAALCRSQATSARRNDPRVRHVVPPARSDGFELSVASRS